MSPEPSTNPLLCDPVTGVCEVPGMEEAKTQTAASRKPLHVTYFTDPICSSCWGIEPQLRRMKLEYGAYLDISYHMGGLLPDWSYNSGGISKPSDVAHHWDEVSVRYNMPIDGDVWLEDPLDSSYPPSIAFKAAQMQDEKKAILFMRYMRELLFLQKKNVTRWVFVEQSAQVSGLDTQQLKVDYEGVANQHFETDLALAKSLGVRGFPTLFFVNQEGQQEKVYGTKPYQVFQAVIQKLYPEAQPKKYDSSLAGILQVYPSLTIRELAELAEMTLEEAAATLNEELREVRLIKIETKNGDLYRKVEAVHHAS
ncbi:MAG: ClpXP adapter SpxH family protein [Bacteroidota bacterium]